MFETLEIILRNTIISIVAGVFSVFPIQNNKKEISTIPPSIVKTENNIPKISSSQEKGTTTKKSLKKIATTTTKNLKKQQQIKTRSLLSPPQVLTQLRLKFYPLSR